MSHPKRAPVVVNPVLLHPYERRYSLDGTWTFRLDPDDVGLAEQWFNHGTFPDDIQVPGTWQGQGFGTDDTETIWDFGLEARIYRATYTGTAWYAKRFKLPDALRATRAWINFGGVHPSAEVWLNGIKLGNHQAPFVPFSFEMTDVLAADADNILVVRVHEAARELGLSYSWQGNWSGLYRSVELTATGPSMIDRFWVHPDVDTHIMRIRARIDVAPSSIAPHVLRLNAQMIGSDAPPISFDAPVTPGDNTIDLPVPSPHLWSPDAPSLYRIDAVLIADGQISDCLSERVGFVKLTMRGHHFCINDGPYYMRGSCDHHSSPLTGCPDWDRETWRKNLATLRDYGYNWIRLLYAYNPEFYEAADEVGMLVQSEMGMLGGWGSHTVWHVYQWPQPMPDQHAALKYHWDYTVMRDVNHPSANLYCMSNELGDSTNHPRTAWQCYHDTKAIKPTAQIIWTDGGYNEHLPGDYVNHGAEFIDKTDKPVMQHEWRWWSSFPDVRQMDRFTGAMRPYAQEIAIEAARRHGIEHVLPQAAVNSQRLQYIEMKGKMEGLRRDNPRLAGVEHTNGTDLIASPQGIVDIFYQRKHADAPMWRQTMGDTVVLSSLDFDDRVLSSGDGIEIALSVSDFAHPPFSKPQLRWRFAAGADEIAVGDLTPAHEAFCTYAAGNIELSAPDVSAPAKATLHAALQEGERSVSNQWDVWLFPDTPAPPDDVAIYQRPQHTWLETVDKLPTVDAATLSASRNVQVLLTERVDQSVIDFARLGGRVILAASEGHVRTFRAKLGLTDAFYFFTPPANYPTYEDGQDGTIIADHPALGDFPHEGFADLQFFRMIRSAPPLDLEGLRLNQGDPIIRVMHCYPLSRPLAYLTECSLGAGSVIFCALDLNQSFPEARYLLTQLCTHAATGTPDPMMEMSAAAVDRLIHASRIP